MKSFARQLVILIMYAAGLLLIGVSLGVLVAPVKPNAKDPLGDAAIRFSCIALLSILGYVSMTFANRLRKNLKNEDGTYLPAWAFKFVGFALAVAPAFQMLAGQKGNAALLPIGIFILAVGKGVRHLFGCRPKTDADLRPKEW
jgi:hypothetical protein